MNVIKVLTITCCLVGAVSCASQPRVGRQALASQASQISPQAVAANEAGQKQVAAQQQQAKLHYMEIGPSLKGDYKFGYDTGSGPAGQSFREETRLDDGTVKGAYGYIDANGKQRIVKYTAGKAGFVVDGDQEAPGQGGPAASPAPREQAPAPVRPQPVQAPQPAPHRHALQTIPQQPQPQQAQPSFDESAPAVPINRAAAQQSHLNAEQLHAQQLRQHQLAQQQALAEQQRVADQQQAQQQQLLLQQQQQPQAPPQQLPREPLNAQFAPRQPAQPLNQQPAHHQVMDQQNGQFFSSSNDANLNELLVNQFRQLQQGAGFAQQQFQAPQQQQPALQQQFQAPPQHFAAQAAPAFHQQQQQQQFQRAPQSLSAPANGPSFENFNHQLRARNVQQQQQPQQPQQAQQLASPQAALLALHQQQQHDAQVLANLRQQQLAQLQRPARPQAQFEAVPVAQPAVVRESFPAQPQFAAPQQPQHQHQQPAQALPSGPINQAAAAPQQPEVFGPPVIDIRTLNYSIGQQTRVN